jgi:hypothetical protein
VPGRPEAWGADSRERAAREKTGGPVPEGLRAGPLLRWIGSFPPRLALLVFFGLALLGAIGTVITKRDPGFLLGLLIIMGSIVAALGIQRRTSYLIIPLPAITYLVLAGLTGAYHDRGIDTSKEAYGLSFLQWIGSGFFAISVATIAVLLVFGVRLLMSRMLVSGQFAMPAQQPPASRSPRSRESRAPRENADPRYRDERGPRDERGQWRDSRPPPGRDVPRGSNQPRSRGPRPRPNDDGWDDPSSWTGR